MEHVCYNTPRIFKASGVCFRIFSCGTHTRACSISTAVSIGVCVCGRADLFPFFPRAQPSLSLSLSSLHGNYFQPADHHTERTMFARLARACFRFRLTKSQNHENRPVRVN